MLRLLPRLCLLLSLCLLSIGCAGWGNRDQVNYQSPPPAPAPVYYP